MKKFFLTTPHWVLFLLMYVLPYTLVFGLSIYMSLQMDQMNDVYYPYPEDFDTDPNAIQDRAQEQMRSALLPMFATYIPLFIGYLGQSLWKFYFANYCNDRLPLKYKVNLKLFNWMVFLPTAIYILVIIGGGVWLYSFDFDMFDNGPPSWIFSLLFVYLFVYLIIGFAFFYCLVKACKPYKIAISLKDATFGDYIGEFFALWFSFVGIWIMQPKINKLENGTLHYTKENTYNHLIE
ncbi:MAG: hypothetical protein AAF487_12925 [Bacteroidota bacterium]